MGTAREAGLDYYDYRDWIEWSPKDITDYASEIASKHRLSEGQINYLKEQLENDAGKEQDGKRKKYYYEYYDNLLKGINYYRGLLGLAITNREQFNCALDIAEQELSEINLRFSIHGSLLH